MRSLTISRLLILFGLAVTAGLTASIGLQTVALGELKIGGPAFNSIANGKDVVADILPPPLYVVEAYMLANESTVRPDRTEINRQKIEELRKSFAERKAYWKTAGLDDALRDNLENIVVPAGEAFWSSLDRLDKAAPAQKAAALQDVMTAFYVQDAKVRDFANIASKELDETVAEADHASQEYTIWTAIGSVASVALFLGGLWFLKRRAISPVIKIADYMSVLAKGDYSQDVPFTERGDEIGTMAHAVDVFRTASIERLHLREAVEKDRLATESQRAEQEERRALSAEELRLVIEKLGAGLNRLAEGNIRITIDEPFAGRFEPLRHDFNNALATFQQTLERVMEKTGEVAENAAEMNHAAEELSKRTEQQAAAVEETSASLEQVVQTVKISTNRMQETRTLARSANDCAASSSAVVKNAVEAMRSIEDSSQKIGQIIHVIDEIAFQTNLLALNAGVEAARAGDAGKGFAVVAQEVRGLAQRAATAANDITALIKTSSDDVSNGVRLVSQTGSALNTITQFVNDIVSQIDEIATASKEQSTGLSEIGNAIVSIDKMTQANAAMVEETAAISTNLSSDAAILAETVSKFKLNRRKTIRDGEALRPSRAA
ncbi:methyl-accepting chemotaxis protein [Oryzifoliimicrobium ureilyticus]|uniref:methyl-accepting chemotaxis protein n=1 Tax=Oryzifoliimicrobium ureilyticus TaxID=3113724 RepID=UPI003076552D